MDLESEEGDEPAQATRPAASSSTAKPRSRAGGSGKGANPYPLEGKYIDEDDREE